MIGQQLGTRTKPISSWFNKAVRAPRLRMMMAWYGVWCWWWPGLVGRATENTRCKFYVNLLVLLAGLCFVVLLNIITTTDRARPGLCACSCIWTLHPVVFLCCLALPALRRGHQRAAAQLRLAGGRLLHFTYVRTYGSCVTASSK